MTTELKDLELAVELAQKELDKAVQAVKDFKSLPENNVYEVLDDDDLRNLRDWADMAYTEIDELQDRLDLANKRLEYIRYLAIEA